MLVIGCCCENGKPDEKCEGEMYREIRWDLDILLVTAIR